VFVQLGGYYTTNSTAAGRNWRRRPHSSFRLDSQCSGDREEEEEVGYNGDVELGTLFVVL